MAVQRYISSSFWSDDWVDSLNITEKCLYLYLLTNECTSICGVYKITIKRIKNDTGISRDEIKEILEKFATAKKAYYTEEYIVLPKWLKHQHLNNPKVMLGTVRALKALPENVIDFLRKPEHFFYNIDDFIADKEKECIEKESFNKKQDTIGYAEKAIANTQNDNNIVSPIQVGEENADCLYQKVRNSSHDSDSDSDSDSLYERDIHIPPDFDASEKKDECIEEPEEPIPKKIDSQALYAAQLLFDLHKKHDTGFSKPKKHIEKWACDIEKLHRLDNRSYADIEAVIRWVKTADNFWLPNIISGSKLRDKFDVVFLQMREPRQGSPPNKKKQFDYNATGDVGEMPF